MSRAPDPSEYVLRVNLKDGSNVRRFCEVRVKGKDVYIYQPRKGASVKVSYHESGEDRPERPDHAADAPRPNRSHRDRGEAVVKEF